MDYIIAPKVFGSGYETNRVGSSGPMRVCAKIRPLIGRIPALENRATAMWSKNTWFGATARPTQRIFVCLN